MKNTFSGLLRIITSDLNNHCNKGLVHKLLTFVFNSAFRLILNYRIGNYLIKRRNLVNNYLLLILKKRQIQKYNCDISYSSYIGKRIKFPHPVSIVIGENAVVGDDVMIWHEVTLGSDGANIKKYPVIENGVKLYSGCKVLGSIKIGENTRIGANSVVIKDIPSNMVAVGAPARILSKK